MATFDQLTAEKRAIIELILKQDRTYADLSSMLGMEENRVRTLAREALVTLSPVSAAEVEEDWRGQIADYLLGQQAGPESTATRGQLRRSESGRAWSRSVLDSLEQFFDPEDLPTIPAGEPAASPPKREARERRELTPEARNVIRRRRLLGAGGLLLAVLVALALLVWPKPFGDDDDGAKAGDGGDDTAQAGTPTIDGQLVLRPVEGTEGAGIAVVASRGDTRQLIVQARLPASANREAYEVWLYSSDSEARSLGAQTTDRQGTFQGAATLPADYEKYRFIDVSREPIDNDAGHSGTSVLRGEIKNIQAPTEAQQGQNTTTAP